MASHEGFSLRMPAGEVPAWQVTNDKGELADVPRPAHALRVWSAEARRFVPIDATLDGAPRTATAIDEWFTSVVRKLKASPYVGGALLDALVSSTRTVRMEALEAVPPEYSVAFQGRVTNRWTRLVLATGAEADDSGRSKSKSTSKAKAKAKSKAESSKSKSKGKAKGGK